MEFDKLCIRYRHIDALQYHPRFCQYLGISYFRACTDPEGGDRGSGPLLENHKAIGFHINTGLDPMENHKAAKTAFKVGPPSACQRNTI